MSSGEIVHALTFDVEDWYQGFVYRGIAGWERYGSRESASIDRILRLLDELNVGATFFVLGKFAESNPDVVRSILAKGHEIATHGYVHKPIPMLGLNSFREDLSRSIDVLESITNVKVIGHRAAVWSMTKMSMWALDVLAERGLVYDSSVFPTRFHRFGIPGANTGPHLVRLSTGRFIHEFPAQVLSLGGVRIPAAGGFYFRALPLAVSKWALRQSQRRERGGMVYLHPFDLDDKVPIVKGGLAFRVIRYYNLSRTEPYLRRLLEEFRFSSIRDILAPRKNGMNGPLKSEQAHD